MSPRVAVLIPARAGSKGVPGKNTRPIHGRSLVERAIDCAKQVPEVRGNIFVSTDSADVVLQAAHCGVFVIHRPAALATDDSPMIHTVMHAVNAMAHPPEILVLLQPTTPSRTWAMVQDAIQMLLRSPEVDAIVSVVPVPIQFSPDLVMVEDHEGLRFFGTPVSARQQATQTFCRDGSFYAMRVSSLLLHGSIYGKVNRAYRLRQDESLNIDTENDWTRAQQLLR